MPLKKTIYFFLNNLAITMKIESLIIPVKPKDVLKRTTLNRSNDNK
jgi:hypothetical protein